MRGLLEMPRVAEVDDEDAISVQDEVGGFDVAMNQTGILVKLAKAVREVPKNLKRLRWAGPAFGVFGRMGDLPAEVVAVDPGLDDEVGVALGLRLPDRREVGAVSLREILQDTQVLNARRASRQDDDGSEIVGSRVVGLQPFTKAGRQVLEDAILAAAQVNALPHTVGSSPKSNLSACHETPLAWEVEVGSPLLDYNPNALGP